MIDAKVRLLRQNLLAIRQRLIKDLDALDQQIAALEENERGSFQIPTDWGASFDRDVEKIMGRRK